MPRSRWLNTMVCWWLIFLPASGLWVRGAVLNWTGVGGNNLWSNAANWQGAVLPGPSDDVVMGGVGEVVHQTGTTRLRSLRCERVLTLRGGSISLEIGASVISGALNLEDGSLTAAGAGTTFEARGAVTLSGTDLTARNGAVIKLPTLTAVIRTANGSINLEANGVGSEIQLPALTLARIADYYHFGLFAHAGGQISAPKLAQIACALNLLATGDSSSIDLSGFPALMRNATPSASRVEVRDGASIQLPNVTEFDRISLTLRGSGAFATAQIQRLTGSTLTLDGATRDFGAVTNLDASSVYLEAGAHLVLAGVKSVARTNSGNLTYSVSDAGSLLDLPNLESASVLPYYQFELYTYSGGEIRAPRLSRVTGASDLFADGDDSVLRLPGFVGTLANLSAGSAQIQALDGGLIEIPNVTTISNINLALYDAGEVTTAQVRSFLHADLTLGGRIGNFPMLTNIDGSSIYLEQGATLRLDNVIRISRPGSGSIQFNVADADSLLALPHLGSVAVQNFYQLELFADRGARIELAEFAQLNGAIDVWSRGAGSVVVLPALAGRLSNNSSGSASIEALDGGSVQIPNVTELQGINLTIRGSSQITTAQLRTFADARLALDDTAGNFPALMNLDGSSLYAEGGARLTLAGITTVTRTDSGSLNFNARDPGSLIALPNLTRAEVRDYYQFELFAVNGGRIDLPKLSQLKGGLEVDVAGVGSIVNLEGLRGQVAHVGPSRSSLEVAAGGAILIPNITGFTGYNLDIRHPGSLPTAQLTALINCNVDIDGGSVNFSALRDTSGTQFQYLNGGTAIFQPPTDLVVAAIMAPASVAASQPFDIIWEIRNTGTSITNATWTDAIYLSSDVQAGDDEYLGSIQSTATLVSGATWRVTNTVQFAARHAGQRYVAIVANSSQSIFEGTNYLNNTKVAAVPLQVRAPDLIVETPVVNPTSARFGQSVAVSWNVKNTGSASISREFHDYVFLVKNNTGTGGGRLLLSKAANFPLDASESYSRSASVGLPIASELDDGLYFLAIEADGFGAIEEGIEANNVVYVPLTLTRPPLPDLAVTTINIPATILPGVAFSVSWSVTNGGAATASGAWDEAIYLVNPQGPAAAQLLARRRLTNELPINASVSRTHSLTIPFETRAGNSRLRIQVDSAHEVAERVETNNELVSTQTLAIPPALSVFIPLTNIAENAVVPNVNALLSRNSDPSTSLVVTLASSLPSEISVPATVAFRAGELSTPFVLSVQRDQIPDENKVVTITARAAGFNAARGQILVENSDIPKLRLQLMAPSLTEGEAIDLVVAHDARINAAVTARLSATGQGQLLVPDIALIPAGQSSVTVQIVANDDSHVDPVRNYGIEAAAAGFIGARANLALKDNDLPVFTLALNVTQVSEGAGLEAAIATVSRGAASPRSLTVELENSNPAAITVAPRVVIPSGQAAVSIPIAAINNDQVDGAKSAILSAFALATIASERIAQSAPVLLAVADDDGPTLKVTASKHLIVEGADPAATVTITRNNSTAQALMVNLSVSDPREIGIPPSALIPAGQASTSVQISGKDDEIIDATKSVVITASAASFASGSVSVVVTDTRRPDLIVDEITIPAAGESEAFVNLGSRILNQGFAPAGTNWLTRLYLSDDPIIGNDTLLAETIFSGTLPVNQYYGQTRQIRLPQTPGQYWVIATTDGSDQIEEILENNNSSISPKPIVVSSAYQAVVAADLESAPAGTPVPLRGSILKTSTGGPVPFGLAAIHIQVRGTQRIIAALADQNGNFTATFNPLPGEAGFYEIGATHPGLTQAPIQDSFTLHGMKARQIEPLRLVEGSSVSGVFMLENLGDRPLTQLAITVSNKPSNLDITVTTTNTLAGLAKVPVGFAIAARDASVPQGAITLRAISAQGAVLDIPIPVTVDSLRPRLTVRPVEIVRGMKVGAQTLVEFDVINEGGLASGPIAIALPVAPWLKLATPSPLRALSPGQTNRVALQLTPPADLALGPYEGTIALNAANASLQVPFQFRAVSEAKGDLRVTAVDEYTFFAEGSPNLAGASVIVRDAVTLQLIATGTTGLDGTFMVPNLAEGYYELELRAEKHTAYRQPHLVLSAQTNQVQAFLRRQAVRYVWTVTPTEIQDRTRISIETLFEAFVPMPVVTIEPPLIDLADYTAEVTQIDLKIVNHGLITAKEAKIQFGEHPEWSLEPLIEDLGDIPARSSFTIPLIIRKLNAGLQRQSRGALHGAGGGGCSISGACRFVIECGGSKLPGSADAPVINASASGNCGGEGAGGPGGGGGGSSGGGGGGGIAGPSDSSANPPTCSKCLMALFQCALDFALPDLGSCMKDLAGCLTAEGAGDTVYNCAKALLSCAEAAGKEIPVLGNAIDAIECAVGLSKSCGTTPGSGGGGSGSGGGVGGDGSGQGSSGGTGRNNNPVAASLARQAFRPLSLSAASGGGTSRVERAELTLFRQRAARVAAMIDPLRYLLGEDAWFHDPSTNAAANWLGRFSAAIQVTTPDREKVSAAELAGLLAAKLPVTVSSDGARALIERWNRSIDYWAAGIFNAAQVPPGQSTDFISIDVFRQLAAASQYALRDSAADGFPRPEDGLRKARDEIAAWMSEGDSAGVCAQVRIRIDQEAVMTRDAFDAGLEIINESDDTLQNIKVAVTVRRRATGEDVTELFALRPPSLAELTAIDGSGVLNAGRTGKSSWIIIPTTEVAANGPEEFLVGGTLQYRQGPLNITVPLAPASIQVYPSPSLAVKYFHERQVFADDPFTVPIEPSIPYSLAVMVRNKGKGVAKNVEIQSAQPKIVDNEKGLFADFKIIATEVAGENLQPSLTVKFGNIDPGTNAIARWLLTSTLLGGFIEYEAVFQHLDGLDNKKLSLVEGIEIHELVHIVRGDDDRRPDFLANDVPDLYDRPDTLHLSDGAVHPVSVVLEGTSDRAPAAGNLQVQLTLNMPRGWAYARIPDPADGKFRLTRVTRADGSEVVFGENAWTTDRTFLGNARRPLVENTLHLFDKDSSGRYSLYYAPTPASDTIPPSSAAAALRAESTTRIPVNWSGEDNPGGSGIAFYDVYVSIDKGPFLHWIEETIDRGAIYQGTYGRHYAFYSVATDVAGNREDEPLVADARTTITATNHAPTLQIVSDQVLREGETLELQLVASDSDHDELTFSLLPGAPIGAVIHPYTGKISWQTTEGSGPKTWPFTVQVLDSGSPRLGATRGFNVTVSDENAPPIIAPIGNRTLNEGQLLSFTASASDIDLPKQLVVFKLDAGSPQGVSIDASSGLLSWRPADFQGGLSYRIGVIASDNGLPSMNSTQFFHVAVQDTRSDLAFSLATTNVLAGQVCSLPLTLNSGADLAVVEFDLLADDSHVGAVQITSAADEVTSASIEALRAGLFRIHMELNATRIAGGLRTIGQLALATTAEGRSSVAELKISNFSALRRNGETVANVTFRGGRVFMIENEPLLDCVLVDSATVRLILYGKPGTQCILETTSDVDGGTVWREAATLTLTTPVHQFDWPIRSFEPAYFRLKRAN